MTIKQKIFMIFAGIGVMSMMSLVVASPQVSAANQCGDVKTAIIKCDGVDDSKVEKSGVWHLLRLTLQILTAGVGVLAVAGIVYGSILYTTAGDKAKQTKKAVSIIVNVAIGIVGYGLMFLLLNFLVPGGVLTT